MSKSVVAIAKFVFSIGIVIILLLNSDLTTLAKTIVFSNYWYFILALIVLFVAMFAAVLRWRTLLARFGSTPNNSDLFKVFCLSYFYNFFIPGGFAGDMIRGYKCKNFMLNETKGLASVFMDRFIGLLSFAIFGIIGIIFINDIFSQTELPILVLMTPLISIAGIIIFFNKKIMGLFKAILILHLPTYQKLKQLYDYIYYYKYYKRIVLQALTISFFVTLCDVTSFYLLSHAIGCSIVFINFLFLIPIITIVSYIPISYSGLGLREISFILLFGQAGMTTDQALAVPIMYFGVMLILSIISGTIFLISNKIDTYQ